jgi:hypothetical protein
VHKLYIVVQTFKTQLFLFSKQDKENIFTRFSTVRGVPPGWGLGEGLITPHFISSWFIQPATGPRKRALVNAVMNLRVPCKRGNFQTS